MQSARVFWHPVEPVILSTSRLLAAHHSAKIIEKEHFNGYSITHRIWSRQYYCRHLTSYWNFNLECECLHHRHHQGLGNGATSRTAIAPSFLLISNAIFSVFPPCRQWELRWWSWCWSSRDWDWNIHNHTYMWTYNWQTNFPWQ